MFELRAERDLGVVDARADRADRARDHVGDLLVGHLLEKAEHQHLAVLGGQAVQRGADVRGVLGGEVMIVRVGGCHGFLQRAVVRHRRFAAPAAVTKRLVPGDAVEPRREGVGVLEAIDLAVNVEPGVLEEVVGGGRLLREIAQEEAQPRRVPRDELREGGLVAGLAAEDQKAVVKGRGGVHWRLRCAPRAEGSKEFCRTPMTTCRKRRAGGRGQRFALGSPVGGGAWSVLAGGPSSSVRIGFRPSAQTW